MGQADAQGKMVATHVESALLENLEADRITLKCFLQICWWQKCERF